MTMVVAAVRSRRTLVALCPALGGKDGSTWRRIAAVAADVGDAGGVRRWLRGGMKVAGSKAGRRERAASRRSIKELLLSLLLLMLGVLVPKRLTSQVVAAVGVTYYTAVTMAITVGSLPPSDGYFSCVRSNVSMGTGFHMLTEHKRTIKVAWAT